MPMLNIKDSLRFKLIIGFVTIAVPLVALLSTTTTMHPIRSGAGGGLE